MLKKPFFICLYRKPKLLCGNICEMYLHLRSIKHFLSALISNKRYNSNIQIRDAIWYLLSLKKYCYFVSGHTMRFLVVASLIAVASAAKMSKFVFLLLFEVWIYKFYVFYMYNQVAKNTSQIF